MTPDGLLDFTYSKGWCAKTRVAGVEGSKYAFDCRQREWSEKETVRFQEVRK